MGLEQNINYKFKNKRLLDEALTHKSYAYDHKIRNNERLEFLGDSILEFISSKYLYKHFPKLDEGKLTKTRAQVVCEESLHKVAQKLEIPKYIKLGHSETANKKTEKVALLADSVEALIAAIYFDGGLKCAEKFIVDNLKEEMKIASENVGQKDYKTALQEQLQANGVVEIKYTIVKETGPDHDKLFVSEVSVDGKYLATGEGKSKKQAEMQAAKKALKMEDED